MRNYAALIGIMGVSALFSCTEGGDTEAPEMDVRFVYPQAQERKVCDVIEPAVYVMDDLQTLAVDLDLSDNDELAELKVDIHANFDCHGHGGVGTIGRPPGENDTEDWRILDIRQLSGREGVQEIRIDPPAFATAGPYHLSFQVLDREGNETEPEFYALYLYNHLDTTGPVILLQEPISGELGTVSKGSVLRFSGEVTDDRSLLDGGNGIVYLVYQDLSSGNYFQGPFVSFDSGDEKAMGFTLDFTVPNTLVKGSYRIFLRAADGVNNLSEALEFQFNIP